MFRGVPCAIADIQACDKGYLLVDQHYLLVVTPEERYDDVIRMPDDFNISVQPHEVFLCVLAVVVDGYFGLLVEDYVD